MYFKNRYEIDGSQMIATGNFGTLFKCRDLQNVSLKLVAKIMSANQGNNNQIQQSILREPLILTQLQIHKNPHIVKCYDIDQNNDKIIIIMEYCEQGDLSKKIKAMKNQQQFFTANEILDFIYQISDGAKLMADNNIFHRDIKPQNILLDIDSQNNIQFKIADFGSARLVQGLGQQSNFTRLGTRFYCSPEIINNQNFSALSDIFSFGIVLYELCFLQLPYNDENEQQKFFQNLQQSMLNINLNKIKGNQVQLNLIESILQRTLAYNQYDRMDWNSIYRQIISNKEVQIPQQQLVLNNVNQEQIQKIGGKHISLLTEKTLLIDNLLRQMRKCQIQGELEAINKDSINLYFTILVCYQHIISQSLLSFSNNTYNKLSKNLKNNIPQNIFQQIIGVCQINQQQITNFCGMCSPENLRLTKNMAQCYINQKQSQKIKEILVAFSTYADQNQTESLNYEEYLDISNEVFYDKIAPHLSQHIKNLVTNSPDFNIFLALQKQFSVSEVYHPQNACSDPNSNQPEMKTNFTTEEAFDFLMKNL